MLQAAMCLFDCLFDRKGSDLWQLHEVRQYRYVILRQSTSKNDLSHEYRTTRQLSQQTLDLWTETTTKDDLYLYPLPYNDLCRMRNQHIRYDSTSLFRHKSEVHQLAEFTEIIVIDHHTVGCDERFRVAFDYIVRRCSMDGTVSYTKNTVTAAASLPRSDHCV